VQRLQELHQKKKERFESHKKEQSMKINELAKQYQDNSSHFNSHLESNPKLRTLDLKNL
jgi:hypothetical protein